MTQIAFLLWIANMLTDTGGQLAFKAAAVEGAEKSGLEHWKHMARRPWIWLGVLCYVAEFFFWMAFLAHVQLSVAVMLASFSIVAIMVAGRILFKEMLTPLRVAGMLLITAGVLIVGVGG